MPPPRGETGIKFAAGTKDHRRSSSGASLPTTSPKPGMKRTTSSTTVPRNQSQSALRKNHSHGALTNRHAGSSKNMAKMAAKAKRRSAEAESAKTHKRKSSGSKDEGHPTVHFDVGDEEEDNDDSEWVEDSGSQSPATTRTHTRQNSVILEASTEGVKVQSEGSKTSEATAAPTTVKPSSSHSNLAAPQPSQSSAMRRTPSADVITSRLLARSTKNAPPETTQATVSTKAEPMARSLSHQSQVSTLNEGGVSADGSQGSGTMQNAPSYNSMTLGSSAAGSKGETVSRFLDNAAGSNAASLAASRHQSSATSEARPVNTNQSIPDQQRDSTFQASTSAPNQEVRRPSSSSEEEKTSSLTPPTAGTLKKSASVIHPPPDLLNHPSRTQQKLWLQRASSNLDPPDAAGPAFTRAGISGLGGLVSGGGYMVPPSQRRSGPHNDKDTSGVNGNAARSHAGEGVLGIMLYPVADGVLGNAADPATRRAQREVTNLFHEVDTEFRGVRRFRDPAGEGVARVFRTKKGPGGFHKKGASIDRQSISSQPPRTPQSRGQEQNQPQRKGVRFDGMATTRPGPTLPGSTMPQETIAEEPENTPYRLSETERLCRLLWDRLDVTGQES